MDDFGEILMNFLYIGEYDEISSNIIDFIVRYTEESYIFDVFKNKIIRIKIKNKLSFLQNISLKFILAEDQRYISCSKTGYCLIQRDGSIISQIPNNTQIDNALSVKGNFILMDDFSILNIYTSCKFEGKFFKFDCDSYGNLFAIKHSGLLYSSNNIDIPLGFYKDLYVKNNILSIVRENGDAFILESNSGKILFKILNKNVHKAVSDGIFFAFIFENQTLEICNTFITLYQSNDFFENIECAEKYIIAKRRDNTVFIWFNPENDDSPMDNFYLSDFENKDIKSFSCQDDFYILQYFNNSILGKGSFINRQIENIIDFSTCENRCLYIDFNYGVNEL